MDTDPVEPEVRRGGLARKYALLWSSLVSALLIASGLGAAYLAYVDTLRAVEALQREKAVAAAARISDFVADIERQLQWVTSSPAVSAGTEPDELRIELLQLLRRLPAVSELRWIDADARERIALSRFALDTIDGGRDWSADPRFAFARRAGEYASPVYFHRGTEPYLSLALAARRGGQVLAAEVNLKFVGEVVSQVRHGETGLAYVVDAQGRLLAHPDLSLVLRMTDMAQLPQVRSLLASNGAAAVTNGRNINDAAVLAAAAPIDRLGWMVFIEQQRGEALAPVTRTVVQSAALVALGIVLSILASMLLARRLVRPIRALQIRAAAIGTGQLAERIEITGNDELQALAQQFNRMAANLQEFYATLEARIADRTEKLARANEAKSRFLAAASHDLRQPMHALGLFVGQLRNAASDEERRALIAHIEQSAGALDSLLDSLLDISRLDAGAVQVRRETFAVGPLIARLAAGFAPAAQDKGIELRARPGQAWVDSDPLLLERILLNLLANALRYTEHGRVLIGCRRRGAQIEIVVADTGIGIGDEHLPNVFREFYQANDSGGEKGLGLGLAIVERLARLLDHPLRVRSEPGRGSCFSVQVPIAPPQATTTAPEVARPDASLAGRRILVIDDDDAVRESMRGLLTQWGCEVLLASDGERAHGLLDAQGDADLVICDLRLGGGKSGLAVAASIAARHSMPVVLLTGETAPEATQAAQDSGLPLLRKPIRPARLRALLESLLH